MMFNRPNEFLLLLSKILLQEIKAGKENGLLSHYCCHTINYVELFFVIDTNIAEEEDLRIHQRSAVTI